jgi:lipoprotein signal peptidase
VDFSQRTRTQDESDQDMMPRTYRKLFWCLVVAGFALDLGTKYAMFRALWQPSGEGHVEVVPGAFRFIAQFTDAEPAASDWRAPLQRLNGPVLPRVNQGALFGLGNDYRIQANSFFMVVSLAAAAAIVWWSSRPATKSDRILCIALGMILGGTLGNLFDRVVFHGVRDFLHFYWFEFPVFNVADSLLVCGAGLLLLQAFCSTHAKNESPSVTVPEMAGTK